MVSLNHNDTGVESTSMTTGSLDGLSTTTNDLIIGETITGSISGFKSSIWKERLIPVLDSFT